MNLLAEIYWDVRPELFQFGPLAVRWYGVLFALFFWISYLIVRWQFRTEGKDEETLGTLLTYIVAGTLIGSRLGHCLVYEPGYYLSHPIDILKIWEGGLSSHGGAVGVLAAIYLYTRKHPDQPYLWLLDRIAVPTAAGGALIRLGNLFNSEILGLPAQVPWAFVFARVDPVPRHPVQLYESIAYACIFVFLVWMYRRFKERTPRGMLLGLLLATFFTARFVMEFFKENQAAYELNLPLSVGQWLSLPFVIVGAILLWRALLAGRRNDRRGAGARS